MAVPDTVRLPQLCRGSGLGSPEIGGKSFEELNPIRVERSLVPWIGTGEAAKKFARRNKAPLPSPLGEKRSQSKELGTLAAKSLAGVSQTGPVRLIADEEDKGRKPLENREMVVIFASNRWKNGLKFENLSTKL